MLDIVLQVAVSAIAGTVVGVAAIIEALSKPFSKLWKSLVATGNFSKLSL
ncbi:hypothetical protein [Lyngbya sp. PCC 8106]|nr:hypothetical protein [Lyngbya sp. PCC 8106]EAW39012.1 hypothetical protein L8106_01817 [Lyngbya sp. PCC 8106]